jgi:GT2 family glycosyltransferase
LRHDPVLKVRRAAAAELRLSTIVVAFGKESLLEDCLHSLDTALEAVDGETELIIVLNRLSPAGWERVSRSLRAPIIVDSGRNLGFAGGVAAGLALARGEWVALVNDDCVAEAGALSELLAAGSKNVDIGSVAARILFAGTSTINSAGIEIDELGIAYERLVGKQVATSEPHVVDVFGASAAAGLYRRAMLEAIGGFDESFFAYLEDADLAWRARMNGWRCVYAPRATFVHHHSSTLGHGSRQKHYLVGRNRIRMLAKNAATAHIQRNAIRMALYDLLYVAFIAATRRTLAPLYGRLRGLREWRAYREIGERHREEITLATSRGIREALGRNRAYRLNSHTGEAK